MSSTEVRTSDASGDASARGVDLKLEVVIIAVSDVDRSKQFYGEHEKRLGGEYGANWPDWYAEYMVREKTGGEPPT